MRKIVSGLQITLDGVVETPDKWISPYYTDEMYKIIGDGVMQADAVLLGRRTYEEFAGYWPNQGSDVPMADFLNNTPKYVVSATLDKLEWANSSLIRGDLVGELTKLKQLPGKNIQVPGSPTLVRSLLRDGLLDELALFVFPIAMGTGMRLFDETTHEVGLKLVQSKPFSTGVLYVTYQPAPIPPASRRGKFGKAKAV